MVIYRLENLIVTNKPRYMSPPGGNCMHWTFCFLNMPSIPNSELTFKYKFPICDTNEVKSRNVSQNNHLDYCTLYSSEPSLFSINVFHTIISSDEKSITHF